MTALGVGNACMPVAYAMRGEARSLVTVGEDEGWAVRYRPKECGV